MTEVATENVILTGSVFDQEGNHIQLINQNKQLRTNDTKAATEMSMGTMEVLNTIQQ